MSSRPLYLLAALALSLSTPVPAFSHDAPLETAERNRMGAAIGELTIINAFARATPPRAAVGGGYLTISNGGDAGDRLIGASASISREIQFHGTEIVDDMVRMRQFVDGIVIPAGETVVLQPGGSHIMFVGLVEPLVEGDSFTLLLEFEFAGSVEVIVPILAVSAEGQHL